MDGRETRVKEPIDRLFAAVAGGPPDPLGAALFDEVAFDVVGRPGVVPLAGIYRGKAEILGYVKAFAAANRVADLVRQFDLVDGVDAHRVATHVGIVADVPATGKRYDLEFVYKFELAPDLSKIRKLTIYDSTWHYAQALGAGDAFVTDQRGTDDFSLLDGGYDAGEKTRRIYDTIYRNWDVESLCAMLPGDAVLIEKGNPALPSNGIFVGPDGLRRLMEGVFSYDRYLATPDFSNFIARGNKADATLDVHFLDVTTGKDYRIKINQSFIYDTQGTIREFKSYHDSQEIWLNHLPG